MNYTVRSIPAAAIRTGLNARTVFNDARLQELAADIAGKGLTQPPTVRRVWQVGDALVAVAEEDTTAWEAAFAGSEPDPERTALCQLVCGERRVRAMRDVLGYTTIPAMIQTMSDDAALSTMATENSHREDLNPMDEARFYGRCQELGKSVAQIVALASVPDRRVRSRLTLLELIPEIQYMVERSSSPLPPSWAESIAPLRPEYQQVVRDWLVNKERPLLRELRAVVGELMRQQAQQALFDDTAFLVQGAVEQSHEDKRERLEQRRFPSDERLPLMRKRGTIGASLEHYIAELRAAGLESEAAIVGRVYEAMLAQGMAYAPKEPVDI